MSTATDCQKTFSILEEFLQLSTKKSTHPPTLKKKKKTEITPTMGTSEDL